MLKIPYWGFLDKKCEGSNELAMPDPVNTSPTHE